MSKRDKSTLAKARYYASACEMEVVPRTKVIKGGETPEDWDNTAGPPVEAWAILCFPHVAETAYIAYGERMFRTREKCEAYIKAVCNNDERAVHVRIVPISTRKPRKARP